MRLRIWLAALALMACGPTLSPAQGLRITQHAPDCRMAAMAFDNPFSDTKGWRMRRYEWHGFYVGLSGVVSELIHHAPLVPDWVRSPIGATSITTIGLGIVPHVRSELIQRTYPIDPLDAAFDLWDKAAPSLYVIGHTDHSWQAHVLAATTWAAGYLALMCYASP